MKKILGLLLLVAVLCWWLHQPAASWRGMPAAADPVQSADGLPPAFNSGDHRITPLARYHIRAVVLARERYRNDPAASISPIDLALGWGPMSVASVLNELSISQSGRWYEYTWSKDPPLDPAEIATHSANTHCLPGDRAVRNQLLAVKRHDVVTLDGYLVEVTGTDGSHWRSSLSRDDTGGGSCEVFWITSVSTVRPPK